MLIGIIVTLICVWVFQKFLYKRIKAEFKRIQWRRNYWKYLEDHYDEWINEDSKTTIAKVDNI